MGRGCSKQALFSFYFFLPYLCSKPQLGTHSAVSCEVVWWGNCIFKLRRCGCGSKKSSSCSAASLLSRAIWPSPAPSACRQRFAGSGGRESSLLVLRREQKCLLRWCRPRRVACVSAEEKFNTLGGVGGTEGCACPGGEALVQRAGVCTVHLPLADWGQAGTAWIVCGLCRASLGSVK